MGDTLNGKCGLQIEDELKLVDHKLSDLRAEGATQQSITLTMKDLGIQRLVYLSLYKALSFFYFNIIKIRKLVDTKIIIFF